MFKIKDKLMMRGGMANACYTYSKSDYRNDQLENIVTEQSQINFNRVVYMNGKITMDDGIQINIWGFNGSNTNINGELVDGVNSNSNSFPSPPMRLTQGQLAHTNLRVNMMLKHTIHHHGIEPDFRSDGVGHTSWDVNNETHTYQWRPSSAGTYFYHCHTNTVLHAEMGMYGALIVDPPEGRGFAYSGGPKYDVEAIWAVDEIDNNWHENIGGSGMANWTAGLCGEDSATLELNVLNPDYFIITGVDAAGISSNVDSSAMKISSGIPATVKVGQTLLIRYINAGYLPQLADFAGLDVKIIASDGHPFRKPDGSPRPEPISGSKFGTVSAERYDIIYTATAADKTRNKGQHIIKFDIKDPITDKVFGTARTKIIVI